MKRLFILMLLFVSMIMGVNAVDYDNITFTNEEFHSTAITQSKVIELSNGGIAVFFIDGTNIKYRYCDLDGTNCGTTFSFSAGTGVDTLDIFEDTTDNNIIIAYGYNSNGYYHKINSISGASIYSYKQFNVGDTAYVSAVQTSSTDFAIGYSDVATTSDAKIIICKLDGSSCGSEVTVNTGTSTYNKLILNSNNLLVYSFNDGTNGVIYERTLTGAASVGATTFNSGATSHIDMIEGSDNKLKIVYSDDGSSQFGTFRSCDLDGTNCGSEIVYNSFGTQFNSLLEINNKLFVQNMLFDSTWKGNTINFNLTGGDISANTIFENALTREIESIFTSNNQILISFDDVLNKGTFAISEALVSGAEITFNNPIQDDYINSTSFLLNVSFSLITNSTYSLNGGTITTLGTNTNESSVSLIGVEGLNNITVFTNTSGELSNSSINFTIDTTTPIINNNIQAEYNSYTIDGFNSSCSDINLASCNISLNSQNVLLNTSSFTFTQNGNISYNITAVDLAGNTATESGVILVNPEQCFNFFLENGTAITNYDFGGSTFTSNPACFNTYNDVLVIGANSFNFEKLGYATTQINFTVNTTSNINNSYNITQSKITINIYDRETGARITDLVQLTGISTIGFNTSTSTGQVNISNINFIAETYQVIASSSNYLTESVYFTYDNQIDITKDIYMLKSNSSNAGIITIKVKDELSNFIEGAIVSALEWKSSLSSFVSVAECQTNIGGSCDLNIELNTKAYKFSAVKNSVSKTTNSQIITTTETIQTITLGVLVLEEVSTLDNLLYSFNETLNINISTTRLEWLDSNGIVGLACISVYKDYGYGQTLLKQNCTSSSNGILYSTNNINNSYDLIIKGTINYDSVTYNLGEFRHFGEGNIAEILVDNNLHIFVPIVFAFIAIAIGIFFGNIYISLSLLILLECIAVVIVPSIITVSVAVVITVITSLIFWGVSKR